MFALARLDQKIVRVRHALADVNSSHEPLVQNPGTWRVVRDNPLAINSCGSPHS